MKLARQQCVNLMVRLIESNTASFAQARRAVMPDRADLDECSPTARMPVLAA
jgi:hypothetical protein